MLIMFRGKTGLSKPEVKKTGCVRSFLYLKNLNFTCLEIFLSLFRLACVQTSPISFVARGKGTFARATKVIGDVCSQANLASSVKTTSNNGLRVVHGQSTTEWNMMTYVNLRSAPSGSKYHG